jgi:hypothetical protein
LLSAADFSGRLIDGLTRQPLRSAEFTLNGAPVAVDDSGRYQVETAAAAQNHYLLRLENGLNYLFVTPRQRLNLQIPSARGAAAGADKPALADIYVSILNSGNIVEKADVVLYRIMPGTNEILTLPRAVRDYTRGRAEYREARRAAETYVLVSANGEIYLQKIPRVLTNAVNEVIVDLAYFAPAEKTDGLAYKDGEDLWRFLPLSAAAEYRISANVTPAFVNSYEGYRQFYFGRQPQFPEDLKYYNLWECGYDTDQGRLLVYTELLPEALDLSRYGEPVLRQVKGYHLANFDFGNFSLARLRRAKEICGAVYVEDLAEQE